MIAPTVKIEDVEALFVRWFKDQVRDHERLRTYKEVEKETGVSRNLLRAAVSERRVKPAVQRGNVVLFHLPTLMDDIVKRGALR